MSLKGKGNAMKTKEGRKTSMQEAHRLAREMRDAAGQQWAQVRREGLAGTASHRAGGRAFGEHLPQPREAKRRRLHEGQPFYVRCNDTSEDPKQHAFGNTSNANQSQSKPRKANQSKEERIRAGQRKSKQRKAEHANQTNVNQRQAKQIKANPCPSQLNQINAQQIKANHKAKGKW